jgi:hypothetical protein
MMDDAQKYPIGELIAQSKAIFGVNPEVVVGAVYQGRADEYSVDEVKGLIKAFLERKVI